MEAEKIYTRSRLEEMKSINETKRVYDYMETCALNKVYKDVLNGNNPDWTAIDNIRRLMDDLMQRLDRLVSDEEAFLKDVLAIVQEN